jgi:tetratricopeptide (TPR) repeat protein
MKLIKYTKPVIFCLLFLSAKSPLQATERIGAKQSINVLHQANNIPLQSFVQNWPSLSQCITDIDDLDSVSETCLDGLSKKALKAGVLNLKSQLSRNRSDNELALDLIKKAIQIEPEQHLHHFQLAINYYQQLRKAASNRDKWMLSMSTAKAYKKAFQLDPTQFHYRYYTIYNYLQVPESMGGSPQKALELANKAITQGYVAFLPVLGDILGQMNRKEEALDAYAAALEANQYKRSSFEKALLLAKEDEKLTERFVQFIAQAEAVINN